MFSKCCWLPWPDGLHIPWSYFRSHTAVSELSDVLTPGNPHARPCNGNATALPPTAHLSRQVMGEQHGIAAREGGGARLGVPRSQAEPRPLKRQILDPFWSDLWCLMSQEKLWRHGVWPALLVKPLLIYLICPGTGLCAATSEKSLWLKEKLTKHTLLYFMPKSARVIFSDQNRNPCKIVGYSENGNSITNGDTNTRGLEFT